jgi:hypothetical protein
MTILASRNVGLLHYLAGSPPQDRQTFSSQEGDV